MDLCEALSNEEFAESTDNAFLNLENGTFINVTQGNRTVVQIDVQCTAQFFVGNFQRVFLVAVCNDFQCRQLQLYAADSLFILCNLTANPDKVAFPKSGDRILALFRYVQRLNQVTTGTQNQECKTTHLADLMYAGTQRDFFSYMICCIREIKFVQQMISIDLCDAVFLLRNILIRISELSAFY